MQLQNHSIEELAGQAAWMMGPLPTSDFTPRVLGRARQLESQATHGPRLQEVDQLAY